MNTQLLPSAHFRGRGNTLPIPLIPAQAGIQRGFWVPRFRVAFAGTRGLLHRLARVNPAALPGSSRTGHPVALARLGPLQGRAVLTCTTREPSPHRTFTSLSP